MTRDEAIKELELIAKVTIWNDRREAVEMAIEALTYQNLSKPNNTCEVDLISREDAMGAVQDHFNADGFKGYYDGQKMMDRITALPSAEEVVRCRGCKWGKPYSDKQLKCNALGLGGLKFPDDFCSYGERKEPCD